MQIQTQPLKFFNFAPFADFVNSEKGKILLKSKNRQHLFIALKDSEFNYYFFALLNFFY